MTPGATIAIPSIPPRAEMLNRAIGSVLTQTLPAAAISVAFDSDRRGAAVTRQRALDAVQTEYVAFLDDDDFFYSNHLEVLHRLALTEGADYCYSWFDGNNPFPMHRGRQMDPNDPHHTTMTVMVRTELAQAVGFANHSDANEVWPGEDWNFTLGCLRVGAKFAGTGEVTWHYSVHSDPATGHSNTSGLPSRW